MSASKKKGQSTLGQSTASPVPVATLGTHSSETVEVDGRFGGWLVKRKNALPSRPTRKDVEASPKYAEPDAAVSDSDKGTLSSLLQKSVPSKQTREYWYLSSLWASKLMTRHAAGQFTRRYFVVDFNANLVYYSNKPDCKKVSFVSFNDLQSVKMIYDPNAIHAAKAGWVYGFLLKTVSREFELYGQSEEARQEWSTALLRAINLNQSSRFRPPPRLSLAESQTSSKVSAAALRAAQQEGDLRRHEGTSPSGKKWAGFGEGREEERKAKLDLSKSHSRRREQGEYSDEPVEEEKLSRYSPRRHHMEKEQMMSMSKVGGTPRLSRTPRESMEKRGGGGGGEGRSPKDVNSLLVEEHRQSQRVAGSPNPLSNRSLKSPKGGGKTPRVVVQAKDSGLEQDEPFQLPLKSNANVSPERAAEGRHSARKHAKTRFYNVSLPTKAPGKDQPKTAAVVPPVPISSIKKEENISPHSDPLGDLLDDLGPVSEALKNAVEGEEGGGSFSLGPFRRGGEEGGEEESPPPSRVNSGRPVGPGARPTTRRSPDRSQRGGEESLRMTQFVKRSARGKEDSGRGTKQLPPPPPAHPQREDNLGIGGGITESEEGGEEGTMWDDWDE